MPVGDSGQLNLIMFELGMITRDPAGLLPDVVTTIAVHPLVVAPSSIAYTDTNKGQTIETAATALRSIAGRALLQVKLEGVWGVESRGLGLFIGTGDLRFKRFWHEIVRLSAATNKEQVDAEKDLLRSPFLSLALKPYDEERSSFFVNYYDFWHDVQFELDPGSFSFQKQARSGGATGLTHYSFDGKEAGPIVTGGLGTTLLNGLFQALTAWDAINELIKSYTLQSVIDSFGAVAGILTSQVAETITAGQDTFKRDSDPVTGLVNGFGTTGDTQSAYAYPDTTTDGDPEREEAPNLKDFLANSEDLSTSARELADALQGLSGAQPPMSSGQVDWRNARGEGQLDALEADVQIDGLHALADAAAFQKAVGALYGMDREEYAEYLASTGRAGNGARLRGSIRHVVRDWDTPAILEREYGVGFEEILLLNRLLPSEALLGGVVLLIPRIRQVGAQSFVDGLPTFGSHSGQAAWGADLYSDLRVDNTGALALVSGEDVLIQGIEWLIAQYGEEVLAFSNEVPDIQDARLTATRRRLASILASDRRLASVDSVAIVDNAGQLDVEINCTAINGGTITTTRT